MKRPYRRCNGTRINPGQWLDHEVAIEVEIVDADGDPWVAEATVPCRITIGCPGDHWTPPEGDDVEVLGPVTLADGRVWDASQWETLVRWSREYHGTHTWTTRLYRLDDEGEGVDVRQALIDGEDYEP